MKLHAYLEQVIGSKTAISITRALLTHQGKVFTVRSLAETAGVSPSEASLVLKQLEETGAVKLQPVGRSFLVGLNEQSFVLRRVMKPIIHAESETLDELIRLLKQSFSADVAKSKREDGITSLYLFGSVVKGAEKKDSDVDLLVISNDYDKAVTLVSKAQEKIGAAFNKQLSPLILSERELLSKRRRRRKKNSELVGSIMDNHILVAGRDVLSELKV